MSLPSRECGLKSVRERPRFRTGTVTPFAGVWIEMLIIHSFSGKCVVTPFAGVWIEIGFNLHAVTTSYTSLPSRECGLKYRKKDGRLILQSSLPSRECGLKLAGLCSILAKMWSLPSRECGLKSTKKNSKSQ